MDIQADTKKKIWTKEEDRTLLELVVEKDLPYAKAALILGRGRAACISRGRRLGIKKGRRIARPGSKSATANHPWRNQRLPQDLNKQYPQFRQGSPSPSPHSASPALDDPCLPHRPHKAHAPAPKRLIDLEPSECRWPVGEAPRQDGIMGMETVFCADEVVRGKPYCKACCARAYVTSR